MVAAPLADLFAPPPAATSQSCLPQPFRWQDLCGPGDGDAKYIALDGDGDAWITLGGELREQTEGINHPDFGLDPGGGYIADDIRALGDFDLRTAAGPRVFLQFSAAGDWGRPITRSFDQSLPDLQQGFVDLPFKLPSSVLTIRVGRQEVDLGDNRLVAVREPANLRLAFDMAMARLDWTAGSLTAFSGRPVINEPGAFDDHSDPGESFSGATLQLGRQGAPVSGAVFGFEHTVRQRILSSGEGNDQRLTLGARLAVSEGGWTVTSQIAHQSGRSLGKDVDALGITGNIGWTWRDVTFRPSFSVIGGYASGDRNPENGTQGDWDPLYPNLGYFTDAPVLFPRNVWDIAPTLSLSLTRSLSTTTGVVLISKLERRDSLYNDAGLPLADAGAPPGLAATLPYVSATWTINPHVVAYGSVVAGATSPGLITGRAEPFEYGLAQLSYRF